MSQCVNTFYKNNIDLSNWLNETLEGNDEVLATLPDGRSYPRIFVTDLQRVLCFDPDKPPKQPFQEITIDKESMKPGMTDDQCRAVVQKIYTLSEENQKLAHKVMEVATQRGWLAFRQFLTPANSICDTRSVQMRTHVSKNSQGEIVVTFEIEGDIKGVMNDGLDVTIFDTPRRFHGTSLVILSNVPNNDEILLQKLPPPSPKKVV